MEEKNTVKSFYKIGYDPISQDKITMRGSSQEVVYITDCPDLVPERRKGNTTRQVDFAIQELFKEKIVVVKDHISLDYKEHSRRGNEMLLDRIIRRLDIEHKHNIKNIQIGTRVQLSNGDIAQIIIYLKD